MLVAIAGLVHLIHFYGIVSFVMAVNILFSPDGSRRWAANNNVSLVEAYETCAQKLAACCHYLARLGINEVWLGLARPENINRAPDEVDAALNGFLRLYDFGHQDGQHLNVKLAGNLSLMPEHFLRRYREQERVQRAGAFTAHLIFGWDTPSEVEELFRQAQADPQAPSDFESLVKRSVIKQPIDLMIRTGMDDSAQGGRLSGMAPWHSRPELYFAGEYAPDFGPEQLELALKEYERRKAA